MMLTRLTRHPGDIRLCNILSVPGLYDCNRRTYVIISTSTSFGGPKLTTFGPWFNIKMSCIGTPIVEIRRSYDRLISTMGFPIPVRWYLYIDSGPCMLPAAHIAQNSDVMTWKSFFVLMLFCTRNQPINGGVPSQRVINCETSIFILCWPKQGYLKNWQSRYRWFGILWRPCNFTVMILANDFSVMPVYSHGIGIANYPESCNEHQLRLWLNKSF